jgi:translation elongation factor EF-Ts
MDQEYIRDPNITVDEYIKQVVGILGENIQVAVTFTCRTRTFYAFNKSNTNL